MLLFGFVSDNLHCLRLRLVWLAIILAAMGAAFFNGEAKIREYFTHPFHIVESYDIDVRIPFPSVTICSSYPLPILGSAANKALSLINEVKQQKCYEPANEEDILDSVSYLYKLSYKF